MQIEELINKRKNELDVETAPSEVWNKIQGEWKPQQKPPFQWWKAAAIIFITFSVGLLIHNINLQRQVDQLASLGDISDEYAEIEHNYIQQVSKLEKEIPIKEAMDLDDLRWIFEELKALEEINSMYRSDIGRISEEQLVGVLIDYYEKKIRLLQKLELELERTKQKQDEKTSTDTVSI